MVADYVQMTAVNSGTAGMKVGPDIAATFLCAVGKWICHI